MAREKKVVHTEVSTEQMESAFADYARAGRTHAKNQCHYGH
jgi:hypothetical protein